MNKCLFCGSDLDPGSEEHVFPAALGGRLVTRKATCTNCNNAFSNDSTGRLEDELARSFALIRNALKIWSGRNAPPPTIPRAGKMENGTEFDLAPGYVPKTRTGPFPANIEAGSQHQLIVPDMSEARRIINVFERRGSPVSIDSVFSVERKVPSINQRIVFDGPKLWRSVAKMAAIGFVVMFGNENARKFVGADLRTSIKCGRPDIAEFAGWDFVNPWPTVVSVQPHDKTPDATSSGFEHSLIVTDVNGYSVGYISLFRKFRFSIRLGEATDLLPRGLALNPRSLKPERFNLNVVAASTFSPRNAGSFLAEHATITKGVEEAVQFALKAWSEEAQAGRVNDLVTELLSAISDAGQDEIAREAAVRNFSEKVAAVELGSAWITELDKSLVDE